MTDVFDSRKRSEVMSKIRGKGNKSTELALVSAFRKAGIKGWRRHLVIKIRSDAEPSYGRDGKAKILAIKPDFVFRKERVAVFGDGCFWHKCPLHSRLPDNNREFWEHKLSQNVERDRIADRELRKAHWRVVRAWEHDIARKSASVMARVRRALHERSA